MYTSENEQLLGSLVLWQAFRAYARERENERGPQTSTRTRDSLWSRLRFSTGDFLIGLGHQLKPHRPSTNQA